MIMDQPHRYDRLRVGMVKLAACSGCQLALLAGTQELLQRLSWCDLSSWTLFSSRQQSPEERFDLVLVEGAVGDADDAALLLRLRGQTPFLVAVGACALGYGVLAGSGPRPVHAVVPVDAGIPGCPPETEELVTLCGAVARGGLPAPHSGVICLACRSRQIRCLIETGQPCLGPVTRAGCHAACPAHGIRCTGCRGRAEEANETELLRLWHEHGVDPEQVGYCLHSFAEAADDDPA